MCYDVHGVTLAPHFGGPCSPGAQMQGGGGDHPAAAAAGLKGGPDLQPGYEWEVDEGRFPHLPAARDLLYECVQVGG